MSQAQRQAQELDKWEWLDLLAGEHGPPDPSTRLVLFVLSLHMSQAGERCFPSQKLIATRSALSERSVRVHLDRAQAAGWIGIYRKRRTGQAWFVNTYVAMIPKELAGLAKEKPWVEDPVYRQPAESSGDARQNLPPVSQHPANGAGHPADIAQHPAESAGTGGNLRHDARQNLPTNLPSNSPSNSSVNLPKNAQPPKATAHVYGKNLKNEKAEASERADSENLVAVKALANIRTRVALSRGKK